MKDTPFTPKPNYLNKEENEILKEALEHLGPDEFLKRTGLSDDVLDTLMNNTPEELAELSRKALEHHNPFGKKDGETTAEAVEDTRNFLEQWKNEKNLFAAMSAHSNQGR